MTKLNLKKISYDVISVTPIQLRHRGRSPNFSILSPAQSKFSATPVIWNRVLLLYPKVCFWILYIDVFEACFMLTTYIPLR